MRLASIHEYAFENISKKLQPSRDKGMTIVTLNGCFDLLHPGLIFILEEAKSQGDILVVGLNSDEYITRKKGESRPYFTLDERITMMEALMPVDYVTYFDEDTPCRFIECIKPDIHANCEEYGTHCIEKDSVEKYGGKLFFVPRIEKYSTTTTMKKLMR